MDIRTQLSYTYDYTAGRPNLTGTCIMYLIGVPDSMDEISILEKIVKEDGSCDWASATVCHSCPLGRSARAAEGKSMSCVEALGVDNLSIIEADMRYKRAALEKLADLAIHRMIEET